MIKCISIWGLAACLLWLAALPARAAIISNPSFEAGGTCRGDLGTCGSQAPWSFIPGPSGALFGVANGAAPGGGSRQAYFGGGTVGSYDTISQLLTTTPGQLYTLTFWLDTSLDHSIGDFRALWNNVPIYDDPAGTDSAHQFSYTQIRVSLLVGTGSDTLAFQGYNRPGNDKFDLVDLQPVPEPASWMMMFAGVLALATLRRIH